MRNYWRLKEQIRTLVRPMAVMTMVLPSLLMATGGTSPGEASDRTESVMDIVDVVLQGAKLHNHTMIVRGPVKYESELYCFFRPAVTLSEEITLLVDQLPITKRHLLVTQCEHDACLVVVDGTLSSTEFTAASLTFDPPLSAPPVNSGTDPVGSIVLRSDTLLGKRRADAVWRQMDAGYLFDYCSVTDISNQRVCKVYIAGVLDGARVARNAARQGSPMCIPESAGEATLNGLMMDRERYPTETAFGWLEDSIWTPFPVPSNAGCGRHGNAPIYLAHARIREILAP